MTLLCSNMHTRIGLNHIEYILIFSSSNMFHANSISYSIAVQATWFVAQ